MAKARKTAPDQPRAKRPVESVRADKFVSGYANYVEVQKTPWDFRLTFGEILTADREKLTVSEFASIVMSPQHAKSLLPLLIQQLAAYENEYGPIPVPGAGRGGKVTVTPGTGTLSVTGEAAALKTPPTRPD